MDYCKEHQCPSCAMNMMREERNGQVFCVGLSNTRFGERKCPFYKTPEQMNDDARTTYERLKKEGQESLIIAYRLKPTWEGVV